MNFARLFFFFNKYPAKTSRSNFSEKFKFSATLCDNTALTIITSCKPLPCRYLTLARIRLRSWSKYNNLTFDSQDVWRCTLLYKQLNEEPCQTEISVKIKVTGKDNFLTPAFQDTFPSQLSEKYLLISYYCLTREVTCQALRSVADRRTSRDYLLFRIIERSDFNLY